VDTPQHQTLSREQICSNVNFFLIRIDKIHFEDNFSTIFDRTSVMNAFFYLLKVFIMLKSALPAVKSLKVYTFIGDLK